MLHWKFKSKKKGPKTDRQKLIRKLDDAFSLFIRLRDSDKNGIVKCITCGAFHHYTEVDCGHFVSREHMGTRWEEENAHGQCQSCNRFKSGKQYEHGLAVDKRHGPGTASKLVVKSKGVCNWTDAELDTMYRYFKNAAKEEKSKRGML